MLTSPQFFVAVETFEDWRQISHNALQTKLSAIHQLMASLAVPFKSVERAFRAWHLDHHPDGICWSLRRVPLVLRQKKHLPLSDGYFQRRFSRRFHHAKNYVSLQLVEELFRRVVMIIETLVRAPQSGPARLDR